MKWTGYDESHNEWLPASAFTSGRNSLVKNWQARNKRRREQQDIEQNKKKAKVVPKKIKPVNRKAKVGDTVAILPAASASIPIYLARVLAVTDRKIRVQWYGSKSVDGTYNLQFAAKKKKGVGAPIIAILWKETVVDTVVSMKGKKSGKIERAELKRLLALVSQARKK